MTETLTETVCTECNWNPDRRTEYCPNCGSEDPWSERSQFDFERDVDLPHVFEMSFYNDTYGLWDEFCHSVWGTRVKSSQIANVPSGVPSMKYCCPSVYYKLDEDLELHGPFMDKGDAKDA